MNLKFRNKRISGILTIIPAQEIAFEDELDNYNFTRAQSLKLKMVMGYDKHRIFDQDVCVSDLLVKGINHLVDQDKLKKEDIDALVVVTQSPDYLMPPTSTIVHGKLDLKQDIFCIDINQGCTGFIVGLYQAFMLLEQENIKKVVLANGDILSHKVSKKDRNSFPLVGDAASITIVERDTTNSEIFGNIKFDGKGWDALMIPAGGFKTPSSAETSVLVDDGAGNFRSKDNLVMKGDSVFNFVQAMVPPLIQDLMEFASVDKASVDYYMFHQPNKFMLKKVADKLGIPHEKMPHNIVENFGNASGVTIPMAITFNLGEKLLTQENLMCLSGFGVGLTWGSMLIKIGNLNFCNIIEY
jgi:3-oxoacyl-[acyl-carrier-protein] synthase III